MRKSGILINKMVSTSNKENKALEFELICKISKIGCKDIICLFMTIIDGVKLLKRS